MSDIRVLNRYLEEHKGVDTFYGHLETTDCIGQGGNSIVYKAVLNNRIVAVKFLVNESKKKINRFKAECLNSIYYRRDLDNSVTYLYSGEFEIENDTHTDQTTVYYIVMKYYNGSLNSELKEAASPITIEKLWKIYSDLKMAITSFEKCNIIHRDIKPENILIDENGNYIISDFGISHFSEDALIDVKTDHSDRLANYWFSAPEQSEKGESVGFPADLYALGQVLYWCVFKRTVRGEGGKHIKSLYSYDKKAKILDAIIHACIKDDYRLRPQNTKDLDELVEKIECENNTYNPFDDMELFSRAVCEIVPEGYGDVFFLEDQEMISNLIENITTKEYTKPIWFNTGSSNNTIKKFEMIGNGHFVLNNQEFSKITRCILSLSSDLYNDLVIFEVEHPDYYYINGEKTDSIIHIYEPFQAKIPEYAADSGYARINGKVYQMRDLKYYSTYVLPTSTERYYAVSPLFGCLQICENDKAFKILQRSELKKETILEFKNSLRKSTEIIRWF